LVKGASCLIVLLEEEHLLARLGHDGSGGHGAGTAADKDGVEVGGDLREKGKKSFNHS
jgi:hypothetical protein